MLKRTEIPELLEASIYCLDPQKGFQYGTFEFPSNNISSFFCENIFIAYSKKNLQLSSREPIIESNIQKGFCRAIPGTIEHTELLTHIIKHAKYKQRQIIIILLDLKNAFGEVDHKLLLKVLEYHHIQT